MARYLVTGAAGFIASKVGEFLLADGHTVVGVDNLNAAYDERLKSWRLDRLRAYPNFEFEQLDITDKPALDALWKAHMPFDAVINLAARAGVRQSVLTPAVYYETNTLGTLHLLELCRAYAVGKFVLASSSSLYGLDNPTPFREDANTDQPLSPYAASKKAAETLCYTYHYLHQIDVTILRYFTVYGPAGRPDMSAFRFVQWISEDRPVTIFGDGKQSRDFTYIDDIARGTIAGLKPLGFQIINLGSDRPIVLQDMIQLIQDKIGKAAKLDYMESHAADMRDTWADISCASALLSWQPTMPFEQGIELLTEWYANNRAWAKDIDTTP